MAEIATSIEESQPKVWLGKKFNHIGKILKISHEIRMNSWIGDYDRDYIKLVLGIRCVASFHTSQG